ncbi:SDR family NAD(P)-dependent oxidoreductase [Devosia algicola]|uniref:SDR family NAD(P)-dependent oxidoreductase n=1 Tax=Devosia algicola TaxID=3026418 RepID=A0ABY7YJI2_9HYPH|nr:SDR family NAD(P)-dependent oxidoreductase [Devosia algicola]WDR01436.1 SDR family NAD(P)-dependent oxidoreductase [Devosia algicola]
MIRRALITGGSAGLGAALVQELMTAGYHITILDRDTPATPHPDVRFLKTDLGQTNTLPVILEHLQPDEQFDLVIFNAGISAVGAFETIERAHLETLINTNLHAPIALTHLLMVQNRLANDASLIFIGSLSNRLGYPGAAVYAASKQGIEAFAHSLRKARQYRVLCVLPGPLDTAHARRYAPAGSKSGARTAPAHLARRVLAHNKRSGILYANAPQFLAGLVGALMPQTATALMRANLFAKLQMAPPVTDAAPDPVQPAGT